MADRNGNQLWIPGFKVQGSGIGEPSDWTIISQ